MRKIGLICILLTACVFLFTLDAQPVVAEEIASSVEMGGGPDYGLPTDPDGGDEIDGDPDDIIEGNKSTTGTLEGPEVVLGQEGVLELAHIEQLMRYLELIGLLLR
jgi:hypothetical protein